MPTKTAHRDYNELLPGFVMSQTDIYINPVPGNMQQRGQGHVALFFFLEKRKSCCHAIKLGVHKKYLFIYDSIHMRFCLPTILMDSQVSKSMF